MSDRISIQREGGVADVRMSRPDKLNALDAAMFLALTEAARSLADDRSLRCVVLSGEGRAFCAGLDVSSFGGRREGEDGPVVDLLSRPPGSIATQAQLAAHVWQELPVPVIAAVHGVAYGGGLQVALGADLRLVTPDAKLSVMEIKWGLIPDMTGSQTLRHLVRLDVAKELTFTGRVVSGEEAVTLGLATRACPDPKAEALALAQSIARRSPEAIRAAKRLLNGSVQADLEAGLALEADLQRTLLGSPNQVETVKAELGKREPRYSDPA
jgi:enoyl-CoA hydratase/carnithine racemase